MRDYKTSPTYLKAGIGVLELMIYGFVVVLFISIMGSPHAAYGLSQEQAPQLNQPVGNLSSPRSDSGFLVLVVDKDNLTAELRTWPKAAEDSEKIFEFRVATGKIVGDKEFQGDKKTPEGIYFTKESISDDQLPPKYGPLAIPLNFPNPMDLIDHKTGYGIWLHGVESDSRVDAANVTDGCVAFYNVDIERLGRWLQPRQTVVMIADDKKDLNKPESLEQIREQTRLWYQAWQNRQLDSFMAFYHDDFRFKGLVKSRYRQHKNRIFKLYDQIELTHDDIRAFVHKKYALTMMNQSFSGDRRYHSTGRKILYWQKNELGIWQIKYEDFSHTLLVPVTYPYSEVEELAKVSPSTKVWSHN